MENKFTKALEEAFQGLTSFRKLKMRKLKNLQKKPMN